MRWSKAKGHEVLDTSTANVVGHLDTLVVDPDRSTVSALVVDGQVVAWKDAGGIGPDAVTIGDPDVLRAPSTPLEQAAVDGDSDPIDKTMLTEDGFALGTLTDLELDAESGAVLELFTSEGRLDGSRLLGVGSFAVVVTSAADADHLADSAQPSSASSGSSAGGRASSKTTGRSNEATGSADELAEHTKDELYEMARSRDLSGRSKMTKAELVQALAE